MFSVICRFEFEKNIARCIAIRLATQDEWHERRTIIKQCDLQLNEDAKKRKKKTSAFSECLAAEFLGAVEKQGGARQKRNEFHKIAYSNRTFLRYRWW